MFNYIVCYNIHVNCRSYLWKRIMFNQLDNVCRNMTSRAHILAWRTAYNSIFNDLLLRWTEKCIFITAQPSPLNYKVVSFWMADEGSFEWGSPSCVLVFLHLGVSVLSVSDAPAGSLHVWFWLPYLSRRSQMQRAIATLTSCLKLSLEIISGLVISEFGHYL